MLETFGINRAEWEFEFQQRDVHPTLMNDLWLRAVRDYMPEELKLPVSNPDYLFTSNFKGYIKSAYKKDILNKISEAIKDRKYLQYIFDRTMGVIEEFDQTVEKIINQKTTKENLKEQWIELEKKYLAMVPWFWIPWYLTEENMLSNKVKAGVEAYQKQIEKIIDMNTAIGILLFPIKEVTFQKEQRDFAELVKMPSGKEFDQKAAEYLKNYSWMKTYFLLPLELLTPEELIERIEQSKKGTFVEEYELQDKKKKEFAEIYEKLIKIFEKDSSLIQDIKDAQELGWLLTASVEKGIQSSAKLIPFLKTTAALIDIPYKNLIHLTVEEIKNGKVIADNLIQERILATAALLQKKEIIWLWGQKGLDFSRWIESGVGVTDINIKEFSGQPAFKGKVTGKVRIALSPNETKDLLPGEILVTSMTSPDYVPAMRRAAAIVTNEGGLLSHAAIMSREFGKPCIVGTKLATKVLKTGDTVEVDADRGIVSIIS